MPESLPPAPPRPSSGREVAITGRLASMSRAEAVRRLVDSGARYVALPSADTHWLVVGQGGPALGEDGRVTLSLRKAIDYVNQGRPLEILREDAFLARLGLEDRQEDIHRLYTTEQLSRILRVPLSVVRNWVRHGLIRPAKVVKRLRFFDFREVTSARELMALAGQGVSPGLLRRSLDQLQRWLGDDALPLAQLENFQQGGPLLVRLPDGRLADPSGQLRLGFETALDGVHAEVAEVAEAGAASGAAEPTPLATPPPTADAETWFQFALEQEDRDEIDAAGAAYERTLGLDPGREEAAFNLGNCHFVRGAYDEAVSAYERATTLDAEYVEAWNNLGIALAELERPEDAARALRHALALAPDYADAHFNLAETLAAAGDFDTARGHWEAYLAQDPNSSWAREVRARLARL